MHSAPEPRCSQQTSGDPVSVGSPFSGDPRSGVLSTRLHPAKEQPWEEEGNLFVNFAFCYGKLLGFKKLQRFEPSPPRAAPPCGWGGFKMCLFL